MNEYVEGVAGATNIITDKGYVKIDSVVNTNINVWNGSMWVNTIPRVVGILRKGYTLVLSNSSVLVCSTNFKVIRHNNTKVPVSELNVGDELASVNLPAITNSPMRILTTTIINQTLKTRLSWLEQLINLNKEYSNDTVVMPSESYLNLSRIQEVLRSVGCNNSIEYSDEHESYCIIVVKSELQKLIDLGVIIDSDIVTNLKDINYKVTVVNLYESPVKLRKTYCFEDNINGTGVFNNVLCDCL